MSNGISGNAAAQIGAMEKAILESAEAGKPEEPEIGEKKEIRKWDDHGKFSP